MNCRYFSQKRGKELDEFKELTQLLPMGFGDDVVGGPVVFADGLFARFERRR